MYKQTILTSVLSLLSPALALPLEPRDTPEFTITSLGATFPYPGVYGVDSVNSFVNVAVTYPDASSTSDATLNTTCRVDWPAGTNPGPTEWTACANPALQFRLPADGWTATTNFRVELFEELASNGAGLYATHILTSNPGNSSDPNAYMFCLQMGKFNPLTCTLTGPWGQSPRTVVMSTTNENGRPN
ncbi:hypothetical protein F4813DRAFT_351125 [Daldinia decipiens]|uniref:uncharacterized protein n=1 Tax=Daldinia decipiens TaxID=326647 RepID=UPI0020C4AE62|nr:uncharacterized protein F4813DRAFT_351125 [Daldinia decipiens]KAI1660149.1 hypothetical protein F4813DRAFT_351125 [Daldinia decipiens]